MKSSQDILEKMLQHTLEYYFGLDDSSLEKHLNFPATATKERVATINDLHVIIYPNDHPPPHFHVKSKDKVIDAKFSIENCELLSGQMSSKYRKRIRAFYYSPKGQIILEKIWQKYHG